MNFTDICDFLDKLPEGKRYKVNPEQAELIKEYMRPRKYDGGINFNSDFTEIYKIPIPK